jgi:hypothetical protein
MRVEDLNPPSSENEEQVRMDKRHVESAVMIQRRSAENHKELLGSGNSNDLHIDNHTQTEKQRRVTKDKKEPLGNPSVRCAPNDAEQLASEAVMNRRRSAGNREEMLRLGNPNDQHVNNHTQTKKQRRATNKDKKAPLGNPSVRSAPNDTEQLASEAAVALGRCSLSRMPVVSAPTDQQSFICAQPIGIPKWTYVRHP